MPTNRFGACGAINYLHVVINAGCAFIVAVDSASSCILVLCSVGIPTGGVGLAATLFALIKI